MRDHQSIEWTMALQESILAMNSQKHSVTKKSPYEIVFGQRIYGDRVIFTQRDSAKVMDEEIPENPENQLPITTSITHTQLSTTTTIIVESSPPISSPGSSSAKNDRVQLHDAVRTSTAQSRQKMMLRDGSKHQLPQFTPGNLVTLKIPKADRKNSDSKRLLCRILEKATGEGFILQSRFGVINRSCAPRELELVPDTILFNVNPGADDIKVRLRAASRLNTEQQNHTNKVKSRLRIFYIIEIY